jgi:hypothetical protein
MKGPTGAITGQWRKAPAESAASALVPTGTDMVDGGRAGPGNRHRPQWPSPEASCGDSPAWAAEHTPNQRPSPKSCANAAAGASSADHRASTLRTMASHFQREEKTKACDTV